MSLRTLLNALSRTLARRHQSMRRRRRSERGMTLVEIMVVVMIIGLVVGVVGPYAFARFVEAQRKAAFAQIKQIGQALDLYRLSNRKYPTTSEGLPALTQPKGNQLPFMERVPLDPWGNEYVYIFPGTNNTAGYDLMSYGPDGVAGGGDDITSWEDANAKPE